MKPAPRNILPIRGYLTAAEAARRLNMTRDQVYRAIHFGPLKAFRIGSKLLRLRPEDVETYARSVR